MIVQRCTAMLTSSPGEAIFRTQSLSGSRVVSRPALAEQTKT